MMNNDWKNYLLQKGAKQNDEGLFIFDDSFSDAQLAEGRDIICDLSHFSTVVIAGDDAVTMMQGQFTNDVNKVDEGHNQISAFCNNKGRMLANFRLFQSQGNYFLSLRSDLVESSIEHLQKYVLRAQVAIQDVSQQLIHLGINGKNAEMLLSEFIGKLDTAVDSVSYNDDYIAIRVAGEIPRYEVFCSLEHAKALWENLSGKASVTNSNYWEFLNIKSGLPFIDSNTREELVPQMANMELINGVSFEKGCYTGQEIVARTHYLGKQKRRTYRVKIISEHEPKPGDQLATNKSTENQYIGTLVNIYRAAKNEYEALAVIQITAAESEKLELKDADSKITVIELPYSLERKE
jgi:tRNA-modifying protein YgfZ